MVSPLDKFFTKMLLIGYFMYLPQSLGQCHPFRFDIFSHTVLEHVSVNKTAHDLSNWEEMSPVGHVRLQLTC